LVEIPIKHYCGKSFDLDIYKVLTVEGGRKKDDG